MTHHDEKKNRLVYKTRIPGTQEWVEVLIETQFEGTYSETRTESNVVNIDETDITHSR